MKELLVTGVCVGRDKEKVQKEPTSSVEMGPHGIIGDKHEGEFIVARFGRHRGETVFNERQWSAVSEEEVRAIEELLGIKIPIGALGENFRFSGIENLTQLPRGTLIRFSSGVGLVVAGENKPCQKPADYLADLTGVESVRRAFVRAANSLRGVVGWVETPSIALREDKATIEFPKERVAGKPIK